ncbi:MAG: 2-oxo acid dehydrogenase subunit E2 [Candidatus Nephthysia bennettiae]|uniref:Dihydrolipoamide acetyltransferase component of pyruvate dehydrogenase complex n=1 Tax=Candidatus Nephthysia bennettiae TaxID=3127016 RepID=A0A934K1R5_9BACT|nr:2-oxo acid dehydrogenase subunit E2 [Candidatus Dormibacteraeota bacterium]MBJ7613505.1 2-oxo acid dehydrogenase subunit E2 [Candidatus Dormibacteraeota bacterium]PZR99255.1 MAG: 2-oxo acid dehydrogenase subunit E2 [Candidatus Dormibacteraeota bacterium]
MSLTKLKMPQLGESVTEGTVDRWLKKEGDFVRRDEPLVEVVTDKVNAEVPSPFEGTLVRIEVGEGQTVPVGTALAELDVEGAARTEAAEAAAPAVDQAGGTPGAAEAALETRATAAPGPAIDGRSRLSPAVRRLADEHGVDLSTLDGSGLGGRVTREDVLAFVASRQPVGAEAAPPSQPAAQASPPPPVPVPAPEVAAEPEDQLVHVGSVRRQIAEHMVRSVHTAPHAWGMREVDMSALVAYREANKDQFRERHGINLTYLPFVIQVVCDALRANPYLNASWTDEGILLRGNLNIGVAVALPDTLIVPVMKNADRLGLLDVARAIHDLSTRARTKSLRPEDVRGGTFTLNNTGAIGSIQGMAIINQPQAAILSTEAIVKRPVVREDQVVIRPIMYLTMSFDHRVVDGLQAGKFLSAVQEGLEAWTPAKIKI